MAALFLLRLGMVIFPAFLVILFLFFMMFHLAVKLFTSRVLLVAVVVCGLLLRMVFAASAGSFFVLYTVFLVSFIVLLVFFIVCRFLTGCRGREIPALALVLHKSVVDVHFVTFCATFHPLFAFAFFAAGEANP